MQIIKYEIKYDKMLYSYKNQITIIGSIGHVDPLYKLGGPRASGWLYTVGCCGGGKIGGR